jgi:hypothetical protein
VLDAGYEASRGVWRGLLVCVLPRPALAKAVAGRKAGAGQEGKRRRGGVGRTELSSPVCTR